MAIINNYFNTFINEEQDEGIAKLKVDNQVQAITILPSFKHKDVEIIKGKTVRRYDDILIKTRKLDFKYCNYQIGCGFLTFLIDLDKDNNLHQVLENTFLNLTNIKQNTATYLFDKILSKSSLAYFKGKAYKDKFSVKPNKWLEIVQGGPNKYLHDINDPYNILRFINNDDKNNRVDSSKVKEYLSPNWLIGNKNRINDKNFMSLTGSHYFDLLSVDKIFENNKGRFDKKYQNKLVVNIHAHGLSLSEIVKKDVLDAIMNGQSNISDDNLLKIIKLMQNQSEINRLALFNKFFTEFTKQLGIIPNLELLSNQAHYNLKPIENREYLYFCDSQDLLDNNLTMLPAGNPTHYSYLVSSGKNSGALDHAISHNLKEFIKQDDGINDIEDNVVLFESYFINKHYFGKQVPKSVGFEKKNLQLKNSPNVEQLMKQLKDEEIISLHLRLKPLYRYHVKKNHEDNFASIGL